MGRVFRRILSFILGFVIGIGSIAGTLVGAAYWAYKKVSLETIGAEVDGLGDLNSMTIEQSIDTALDMFKNPQNYSITDLEEKYGFELETFLSSFGLELKPEEEQTADDKANIEAMKNMNLAYLFGGGFDNFLDSLNTRVIFNFLPDSFLSDGARARLGQYSLSELISTDPITGNLGLIDALGQVKFGSLFPDYFDEIYNPTVHTYTYKYLSDGPEDSKNWLDLLGNLNFGSLLNSFITGKSEIIDELMSGRLTDLSDKPIKEVLAEIGDIFPDGMGDTLYQYASVLGDSAISDWFILDEEDDKTYTFSLDNFLRAIKVGYAFGYVQAVKTEVDGVAYYEQIDARERDQVSTASQVEGEIVWVKNTGTDENPEFEEATGITGIFADVDVYNIYTAYQNGTLSDTIVDELSDFSIGTIYEEFLGYKKNEFGEWETSDGEPAMNCLTAFAEISVSDILSEQGGIVDNLLNALKKSVDGYLIGDFVSDFVDFTQNEQGYWVDEDGDHIVSVLNGIFSIEINDFIMDDFSATEFVKILKEAVGECEVGEILGYTRIGGVWCDDQEELSEMMNFISDLKIRNVLDIFLTDFTPTQILKAIFGEATVQDVLVAFAKFTYDEQTGILYNFNDQETVKALQILKDSKVWELVAAFDDGTAHDVFPVLYQIEIGDFVGKYNYDEQADYKYWTLENFIFDEPVRITGALNKILSLNLGQMVDPEVSASEVLEPLKEITIGEIAQSACGLYLSATDGEVDWESDYGLKVFDFMRVFAEIPTSIQNIIDFIDGEQTLEEFLTYMLDGVRLGDLTADLLGISYDKNSEVWISDDDMTSKVYEIVAFLLDYQVINDTYLIINSEEKLQTIAEMVEGLEIGHIAEPFMSISKPAGAEWNNADGDLYTIFKDLFGVDLSYIVELIDQIIKGEDVQASEVIANVCGKDRTVGQYLSEFIPKLDFKPLEKNVYDIVIYQFVDIIFENDWLVHGFDAKRDYVKYLFGDIKVGHFLEPIDSLDLLEQGDIWVKKSDNGVKFYNLLCALCNIKPYEIGEFIVDTVSDGDFAYDKLYAIIFGEETTVGHYFYEFFDQQYNQQKQVWTNADGFILYSYMQVLYDIVPYAYLNQARGVGFAQATRNTFGHLLFGDFVYDIVMDKLDFLKVNAYKDQESGLYVNYGEWDRLADTLYNSSIEEVYQNTNLTYWKNKFFDLYVGDYLASFARIAIDALGYDTKIVFDKQGDYYFVTEQFNKILSTVFNRTVNNVIDNMINDGPYIFLTEDWFRDIMVGDFLDYGLYHYNPASELWYDREEVVPFDFDLMSILKQEVISLSVYDLTHNFDYMTLFDNLFLGNAMALTRYAEFIDPTNGETVYLDAGRTYTINAQGKEQKFAYEVYTDGDGNWFYYNPQTELEITLTIEEYMWYDTKLFKSLFGVESIKNQDGSYTIYQTSTGIVYPCEYIAENDVYKVNINGKDEYFIIYNGTFYQAEPSGDLKRYYKNFIVQKLSDVRLYDMINGYDIEKMLGTYYVGEVMGNYKGGVDKTAAELGYRQYDTYNWYKDEELTVKLDGMDSVVANIKLQAVFDGKINFHKEIEHLKIIDIVENADEISILHVIANNTIGELKDEEVFDRIHIGQIMEYEEKQLQQDTEGDFIFPATVKGADYKFYARKKVKDSSGKVVYGANGKPTYYTHYIDNILSDTVGNYYELGGTKYYLKEVKVWCATNDVEMVDGYEIKDYKIYDGSGNYLGDITYVSDDYHTSTVGSLEHLILRDGRWYRAYPDKEHLITPCDELIEILADLTIEDITEGSDFVGTITDRVKNEVHMGKFFKVADVDDGVFKLFTQEELDNMLISDFANESTDKVKNATIQKLLDTKIVSLTDAEKEILDKAFTDPNNPWTEMKINTFVSQLIGLVGTITP